MLYCRTIVNTWGGRRTNQAPATTPLTMALPLFKVSYSQGWKLFPMRCAELLKAPGPPVFGRRTAGYNLIKRRIANCRRPSLMLSK